MNQARLFLAVTTAKFVSVAGLMVMPLQIGALMDGLGLGAAAAGLLGTLEFSALGCGLLLAASGLLRVSVRGCALIGVALIVSAQTASAFVDAYPALAGLRFLVGLGAGLANAAATVAIAAQFRQPERVAGFAFGLVYVAGGLLYLASPQAVAFGHQRGVFLGLAAVALCCAPGLLALPRVRPTRKKRAATQGGPAPARSGVALPAGLLFAAEIALMAGMGAVWAFGERLGLAIGLTSQTISVWLAATMLASIAGSLFTGWMGLRFGRTGPYLTGIALVSGCCFFMAHPGAAVVFIICLLGFQAVQAVFIPFLIGTGAALDPSGRLSAAVVGVEIFSFGAGAFIGGVAVEAFGLQAVGWLALLGGALAAPLFFLVCRLIDRPSAGGAPVELRRGGLESAGEHGDHVIDMAPREDQGRRDD